MIIIGFGSNLPAASIGQPDDILHFAIAELAARGVAVSSLSHFWRTAPVPSSDQPWFINAVGVVQTDHPPSRLLGLMHEVEELAGRRRGQRNEARSLDLDLIDYDGLVSGPGAVPILPHPRAHLRAFVLRPLAEVAPEWRHPVSGASVANLIAALDGSQVVEMLEN